MIGFGNEPNLVFALTFRQCCRKVSALRRHGGLGFTPASAFVIQMLCLRQRRHRRRWYLKGADNTPYEKIGDEVRSLADEVPFDIPDSWEWVRLGNISSYAETKQKVNATSADPSIWGLDLEDIEKGGRLLEHKTVGERKAVGDKTVFVKGDILYSKLRPYLLKILVAPDDGICTPEIVPFRVYGGINPNYIVNYLKSPYVDNLINSITYGVKMPRVGTETMTSLLVPIPPLEEQLRIVEKIDEVASAVSAYDVAYQKTEALNSTFPEALKKSILQEAVQGKLVPQDPIDESAEALPERIRAEKQRLIKEGKIKKAKHESIIFRRDNSHYEKLDGVERCIDEELPFEIPETWAWVRIGTILSVSSGDSLTVAQMNSAGSIPVYGGNGIAGTHDKWNVCHRTLVIGRVGYYCGATHITEPFAWVTDNAFITHFDEELLQMKWLKFLIDYLEPRKRASSTAQPVISGKLLYPMLVPIPPLNEQHRIVQRIEELLTMVKGL